MSAVAQAYPTARVRAPCRAPPRRRTSVVVRSAAKATSKTSPVDDTSSKSKPETPASPRKPKVAIVGAGWGGFGAAKALCEAGCDVTLLDGIPDPTGLTPSVTPTGKPFEYGTRGFWKDYPNIEGTLRELGVKEADVFSDFTASSFFSPDGLEATAPVFSSSEFPTLPSPFGQVFATFDNFKRLPLEDRASMVGLLYAMLDLNRDPETFKAYDRMTAHDLFIKFGLSKRLVDDFIRPTLLVGLFKPPEELSAAVTMELLYYYALAHQDSFDVRWVSKGTVSSSLIAPLATHLIDTYDLKVLGGCRVEEVIMDESSKNATGVRYQKFNGKTKKPKSFELNDVDAVVLALGAKGMRGVVGGSPQLAQQAPELSKAASLGGIDVVTTRIWLDRYVAVENPANVLSRFDKLRGAGGTFFMLDQLQQDNEVELWGGAEPKGSVLACDFYNGGAVATLSDEDIIGLLMDELLPTAVPAFKQAKVLDSHVVRCPGAVTWFSPGSFACRPPLETSISNITCAGDWVRMGEREHGSKGLCQERAFVSGLEAGNSLSRRVLKNLENSEATNREHVVLPIRADETQVVVGRSINKAVMDVLKPFGFDSPWVR
tara:strand:- start:8947 stop:10749 length:1803 start_codon:yes stop_codon:yes gene_type:complete